MAAAEKPKRQPVIVDIFSKEDFGDETVNQTVKGLQEGLKLSLKNKKDRARIFKSYIDLGAAYYRLFRYDQAETCHWKHLNMAKEKKYLNEEQVKTALTNLGCVLKQRMEYDEALVLYKEALEIAERIDDMRAYARLLNNMGNAYESMFDFESAIGCFEKRAELATDLKDSDGQIKAYACLGSIYNLRGELRKSIMYYDKVIINVRMKLGRPNCIFIFSELHKAKQKKNIWLRLFVS